ncbi:hypothetical protein [Rhodovulum strictum]|uniref:Uncharacterized protein n=1 Tax=Rhodovulum strictum TaxID=58314 RepID=A0A844BJP9_9RHOB|nr:hypothetical protein [Rhodovulum strictum]MRH21252.1 hypothetical protein [Rhodovulum strictum]
MHRTTLLAAALAVLASGPDPAAAQIAAPGPAHPHALAAPGLTRVTATAATTDRIVARIEAARDFCGRIAQHAYVIDCLAAHLEGVARDMPGGDYRAAGQILDRTARDLRRLAEANADPALPRGRVRVGNATSPRALTPVRPDALGRIGPQASAILQEAETQLLRSAEGSERRMVHYRRIAAAVGSTKFLMRSARLGQEQGQKVAIMRGIADLPEKSKTLSTIACDQIPTPGDRSTAT